MVRTEVLIIGGGPAGSSCAWALRKRGIDAVILDREIFPRPKLCAGWITPELLGDLEIGPDDYPYGLTRLGRIELSIRGLRFRLRTGQFAIRRIEFDDWLLKRSGVPVYHHTARGIRATGGGYLVDDEYFGRYLVGAGGTACPVARTLFTGLNPRPASTLIVTQEEEFFASPRPPGEGPDTAETCGRVRLWFFENGLPGYAWYVPKAGGIVNVGVGARVYDLKRRDDTIRRHWDLLVARVRALGLAGDHAFSPKGHPYYLRERTWGPKTPRPSLRSGNAFIIGDAACLATSDMGEGIAPAIRSGLLAAEAVAEGRILDARRIRRWSQPWPISRVLAGG